MEQIPSVEQVRSAVSTATTMLLTLGARTARVQEADLGELMSEVAALGRAVGAATIAVAAEADERGLPADSGPFGSLGGDLKAWVGERSPGAHPTEVARIAKLVKAGRTHTHAPLLDALTSGRVDLRVGEVCLTEVVKTKDYFPAEAVSAVWEGFLLSAEDGCSVRDLRQVRDHLIATHGEQGQFQELADTAARFVSLSAPRLVDSPAGHGNLWAYRLVTDDPGRAVIEAAIGPLSKPAPTTGEPGSGGPQERDTRLPDRRRAEALIGMLHRATTAGTDLPSVTRTQLVLTATLTDLTTNTGAAQVLGTLDPGLLAPETLRRLTCDATVTPLVVGDDGDLLHLGRTRRLFSSAQLKALWVRDRGCTYPGCDIPAHWTDAHHLLHWADGGGTDLENAALLCGFHHTLVHQRRLQGALAPPGDPPEITDRATSTGRPDLRRILWDAVPGSYDRALERAADRPDHPPAA